MAARHPWDGGIFAVREPKPDLPYPVGHGPIMYDGLPLFTNPPSTDIDAETLTPTGLDHGSFQVGWFTGRGSR